MHKVYENDDLMMYFKKRYCHCCGSVLQRKRTERTVRQGDPDHREYCTIGTNYKPHGDILVVGKEYYCSLCKKSFSCDEQGKIIDAQKHYGKRIVTNQEINDIHNNTIYAKKQIKKLRWVLFLPIVGGLICNFFIFNGELSEKTNKKDATKLLLASVAVLIGVALAVKLVLSIFDSVEFINNYKDLFVLIFAAVSFNIPVLWYINYKFK